MVYLRPYKWALVIVFTLVAVGSLLDLAGPYLIGVAIDKYITARDLGGLLRISLLMLGVYVAAWLTMVIRDTIMAANAQKAMRVLRCDLF